MAAHLDDIEDMIGEEELSRADMNVARAAVVAPKRTPGALAHRSRDSDDDRTSVPGTQLIWLKTYGCSHNVSDSEYMQGVLASYGYRFTQDANEAQLWLLNSCTVKDPSQAAFMHLVTKGRGLGKAVVVAGCVPQADRYLKGLDGVSIVGIQQVDRVVEVVEETLKGHSVRLLAKHRLPELDLPKIRKNPMVEIIPLSTGCLGACTYCKTRHARGQLGSYAVDAIVARAQSVVNEGVTELWLSSEDTGAYGLDIGTDLPTLLRAVLAVLPRDVMLRVGMTNPPYILTHLDAIADVLNHDSVYSFLHVPVQSGSDDVLLAMNREYTARDFCTVADKLLANVPGLTLATDIICGFPGETDAHFSETLALVARYQFHILNISQFYPRPGTPAAKMTRVPTQVVKGRSRTLTTLFERLDPYVALVGTTQKVWINTEVSDDERFTVAHTKNYTKVLLKRDDNLVGCTAVVRIDTSARFHVTATVVTQSEPVTEAAAAIRRDILARGRQSAADHANRLARTSGDGDVSGGCGSDSDCSSCDEDGDVEDTCSSSPSSTNGGCGSDGGCGGKGKSESGCCSGAGGAECCSSTKFKKTLKAQKTQKPTRTFASSLSDRLRELYDDKVALAAVATIVASTALITTRLLRARQ